MKVVACVGCWWPTGGRWCSWCCGGGGCSGDVAAGVMMLSGSLVGCGVGWRGGGGEWGELAEGRPKSRQKMGDDAGKWITVLYGKLVEFTIVDTHSEGSVFLLDKQDRSSPGLRTQSNKSFVRKFL
ncbi:hypothetical protein Tco_0363884 [Tanacetum coccineum]